MKTLEEQKRILTEEIEKGNLFAWNDGDGGVFEAIANQQTSATFDDAKRDLVDELYSEKDMKYWPNWSKVDLYDKQLNDGYSQESCHTWIYDLKEIADKLNNDNN